MYYNVWNWLSDFQFRHRFERPDAFVMFQTVLKSSKILTEIQLFFKENLTPMTLGSPCNIPVSRIAFCQLVYVLGLFRQIAIPLIDLAFCALPRNLVCISNKCRAASVDLRIETKLIGSYCLPILSFRFSLENFEWRRLDSLANQRAHSTIHPPNGCMSRPCVARQSFDKSGMLVLAAISSLTEFC